MNKIINSVRTLNEAIVILKQEFDKHKYLACRTYTDKRTLDQNALQFHWYRELEEQSEGETAAYYRNYCKYHFGCAIRAEGDPYFAAEMKRILKLYVYEDRLEIMSFIDITSTFTPKQMSRYCDQVYYHFTEEGFTLTSRKNK